ncbi:outer membrane beta-barrel protein [Litoribacillus peritrichatus]|uniref:Outer membrane protein beta-barrel domain-containing protein n=1 Tax=Litoribacillus peritrichatus TaxID=718191 RepID=A0ABP7MUQ9_9GAMM
MTIKNQTFIASVISSAVFIAPAVSASDWYTGLEVGGGKHSSSFSSNVEVDKDDPVKEAAGKLDSANYLRINLGRYITDNVRVYGYAQSGSKSEVSYIETDFETTDKTKFEKNDYQFGVGSDYLYQFNDDWSFVAGGNLGYYNSSLDFKFSQKDDEGNSASLKKSSTNRGAVAGLNAGFGYNLTEDWTIETGLKYSMFNDNEHKLKFDDEENSQLKYKYKDATQYYLNASYRF